MSRHENGRVDCPKCEEFLLQAHPDMVRWYRQVKPKFLTAHISCSWRGKADQERAVDEGKSQLHWPWSKHNRVFPSGAPAAEALDLFEMEVRAGKAVAKWDPQFFARIAELARTLDIPTRWGGNFTWRDTPHFELSQALVKPATDGG